ncbi:MAG: hypothetical protein GXP25_06695 [Planctomycetes bacterium]|nr:hypothetical protein [Planctomycetota bacterium]
MTTKKVPWVRDVSRALLLFATIVVISGAAFAAEVRMKNGNLFKGEIVFESNTFIILDIGAGQITLQKSNIKKIIKKDRFAVPPKKEGAKAASRPEKQAQAPARKTSPGARPSPKTDAHARAEAERARKEEERKRKEEEEEQRWGLTSLEWEAENIKAHTPGTPAMFAWKGLEESLAAIREGTKPALVYAYNPEEKRETYYYEKKLFPNPRFSRLNLDFLLVMVDSTKEVKKEELKSCMNDLSGKTGVAILNKDLGVDKASSILGTPLPSPNKFSEFLDKVRLGIVASKYKPGSIGTFGWTPCEKGFKLMGAMKKPGLLYLFPGKPKNMDERTAAYLIECKLLPDERLRDLGAQFVMMKADINGTDPNVPKSVRGKVGITCWTFDRKKSFPWALRGTQVDVDDFDSVVKRAIEENKITKYKPGSGTSFNWLDLATGVAKLKGGNRPGILYAYWPEDQRNAYLWERKVFNQPELKDLSQRFVMIRGNVADVHKAEGGKLPTVRKPQCVVFVLAPDLTVLGHAPSFLDVKRFCDMLDRAEKAMEKPAGAKNSTR